MLKKLLLFMFLFSGQLYGQGASPIPFVKPQWSDANGLPYVGGKLYTCVAGSPCPGTPLTSYTTSAGSMGGSNTNPVILDSAGRANVWLGNGLSYRLVLLTSADASVWDVDNVTAPSDVFNDIDIDGTATFNGPMVDENGHNIKVWFESSDVVQLYDTSQYVVIGSSTLFDTDIKLDVEGMIRARKATTATPALGDGLILFYRDNDPFTTPSAAGNITSTASIAGLQYLRPLILSGSSLIFLNGTTSGSVLGFTMALTEDHAVQLYPQTSAPALSTAGLAKFYFNTASGFLCSVNGSAYTSCIANATGVAPAGGWTDNGTTVSPATLTDIVTIGDTTAASTFTELMQIQNTTKPLMLWNWSATAANAPRLIIGRALGTKASPSAVIDGSYLGILSFGGRSNSDYLPGPQIYSIARNTWAAGAPNVQDADMVFATTTGTVSGEPEERMRLLSTGQLHLTELTTNPGTTQLAASAAVTVYSKANKLVFAFNLAGTMNYVTLDLDGSDTSWSQGTGAP